MAQKIKTVVIAGPTAAGKTSFGVDMALALNGEIINADSMQVYRGMDIGTAKPTDEEKKGIPHHLMDVVDPDEEFNAAIFRNRALPILKEIFSRKKVCLVVGGTGLYIKSLLDGIFECPPVDLDFRESLRKECDNQGAQRLHQRLMRLDPKSAVTIHPNDRARIIRALEIIRLTGKSPLDVKREQAQINPPLCALKLYLKVDREMLYRRIDKRTKDMFKAGLIDETENLLKQGYSPALKPMKAIGYRHIIDYLENRCSLSDTVDKIQRDTRRYAKRQMTWFKADQDATWIDPSDFDLALEKIKVFLTDRQETC